MEITYEVADGYVGGSRPQKLRVDDDDLRECENAEEAMEIVEAAIQEHFEANIVPNYSYDKLKTEVESLLAEAREDNSAH